MLGVLMVADAVIVGAGCDLAHFGRVRRSRVPPRRPRLAGRAAASSLHQEAPLKRSNASTTESQPGHSAWGSRARVGPFGVMSDNCQAMSYVLSLILFLYFGGNEKRPS